MRGREVWKKISYELPGYKQFTDELSVSGDPLENRSIYLRTSEEFPDAEEGIFARHLIPANTIFSLFSGKMYSVTRFQEIKAEIRRDFRQRKLKMSDPEFLSITKFRFE